MGVILYVSLPSSRDITTRNRVTVRRSLALPHRPVTHPLDGDFMKTSGLRILLVQQEWTNWQQSRSWAYGAHIGLEHGLSANGIETLTITSVWSSDAMRMLEGQKFDQVW